MPLRELEAFAVPRSEELTVYCNRGLNGIDGVVATAHGVAMAHDGPTVALIGDVALAHDIGSLQLGSRLGTSLTIVLVDNGGGAIFDHLPVAGMEPMFTRHFTTSTGLTWEACAELFGISVTTVTDRSGLGQELVDSLDSKGTKLIVVRTDREAAHEFREDVLTSLES